MSGRQTGGAVSLIMKVSVSQYWHELENPATVVLRSHWPGLLYKRSSLFLLCHTMLLFVAAKLLQLCPTLCDPIDGSPPGSPVPGILQARTLEWVAMPSPMHKSEKWKWTRSVVSDSYRPHGLQPTRLLRPWDFPGKSTRVGLHCLLCFCLQVNL